MEPFWGWPAAFPRTTPRQKCFQWNLGYVRMLLSKSQGVVCNKIVPQPLYLWWSVEWMMPSFGGIGDRGKPPVWHKSILSRQSWDRHICNVGEGSDQAGGAGWLWGGEWVICWIPGAVMLPVLLPSEVNLSGCSLINPWAVHCVRASWGTNRSGERCQRCGWPSLQESASGWFSKGVLLTVILEQTQGVWGQSLTGEAKWNYLLGSCLV